eukprot:TRINITY_DN9029_c0_g1_i1.p1 TRINITY_DN9029_c0_g1~~TRINITY_DN9029_c0_g1_i1.p1  ORF type:complete len:619 (-),score=99.74 TRINITY_DN9029_c0_g1_i1:220-1980(-)
MQVRIDAVPGQDAPDDTFVAMRVGDVQKQSRYAAARVYRFPEPRDGRGRFGRIEVYQRVGHVTLRVDTSGDFKLVEVPCKFVGDAGGNAKSSPRCLDFHVAAARIGETTADAKSMAQDRMALAQEYLEQHQLEETIADAMREVVHLKPKDPHAFLSSYILRRASDSTGIASGSPVGGVTLPPIANKTKQAGQKEPAASSSVSPPPAPERASSPVLKQSTSEPRLAKAFEPKLSRPPSRCELRKLPPLDAKPAMTSPKQFSAGRPQSSTPYSKAAAVAPATRAFSAAPSKAVLRRTGLPVQANFQEYYQSNFKSCGDALFSRLHASFVERRPASCVPGAEAGENVTPLPLKHMASVGTWFAPLPLKRAIASEPTKEEHAQSEMIDAGIVAMEPVSDGESPVSDNELDSDKPWYYHPYEGEDAEIVGQIQEVIAQKDTELEDLRAQIRLLALAKGVLTSPLVSPEASPRYGSCSVELLPPQQRRFLQSACHAQMPPTSLSSLPDVVDSAPARVDTVKSASIGRSSRSFRSYCTANIRGMLKKTHDWHSKFKILPRQGLLSGTPFIAALRAEIARKDEEIQVLRLKLKA